MPNMTSRVDSMQLGHLRLGHGELVVATPVVAKTLQEVRQQWGEARKLGADLIEWRLDHLEEVSEDEVAALGQEMLRTHGLPVIATYRTNQEGGLAQGESGYLDPVSGRKSELGEAVLAAGSWANVVDIEMERVGSTELLREMKVPVVASFHEFETAVSPDFLQKLLWRMVDSGAGIVKVAHHVDTDCELQAVLDLQGWAWNNLPVPAVVIAMGQKGIPSRVGHQARISAFTFASAGWSSAPGQLTIGQVRARDEGGNHEG